MRLVGRAHVSAETVRNETNHHRERRRTSEDVITPRSPLARPLATSLRLREKISTFFQTFSAVFRPSVRVRPSVHFPPKAMGETVGTAPRRQAASQPERCSPLLRTPPPTQSKQIRQTGCRLITLFSTRGSEVRRDTRVFHAALVPIPFPPAN